MVLASLFFATMGVCIKFASSHFNSFEIVCYRGVVGVVFLVGLLLAALLQSACTSAREQQLPGEIAASPAPFLHVAKVW